jgi:acetyl-CoA C-acetyltransferase
VPEAVVVSVARSPIGRALKGSLATMRPDDLTSQVVQAVLGKVPELDPREIDDLMLGCAQPAGEAGYNIARAVPVAGLRLPSRHRRQPLLFVVAADHPDGVHAIKAGEADVLISAGVETVSRWVTRSA